MFWLATQSLSKPIVITNGSETKICKKQIRGIYYNSARWARLWPMDLDTLNLLSGAGVGYENLSMKGWFYTSCEGDSSKYGIFGVITFNWNGTKSYLIAWTKLNYTTNSYINSFTDNFQYFNNTTPLGFFWDSVGGIAFIGGDISGYEDLINYLNSTGNINETFKLSNNNITSSSTDRSITPSTGSAQDTMWNILVQGNVILSKAIDIYERKAFLGNLEKRTILLNGTDLNSATVINTAKKNAESLCRGKTYFVSPTSTTLPSNNNEKVLCYKNVNLTIDLNDSSKYLNKTIIMKKWNIILSNSMKKNSPSLDLFIDEGSLYIDNSINWNTAETFDKNGFPTTTDIVNSWLFLKGNFVINGLLIGWTPSNETTIKNKLHLQGRIATLNTPTNPGDGRTEQISSLLWSTYTSWINLENIFTWQCWLDWIANDGSVCIWDASITLTPFVVLNGNFSSNILK